MLGQVTWWVKRWRFSTSDQSVLFWGPLLSGKRLNSIVSGSFFLRRVFPLNLLVCWIIWLEIQTTSFELYIQILDYWFDVLIVQSLTRGIVQVIDVLKDIKDTHHFELFSSMLIFLKSVKPTEKVVKKIIFLQNFEDQLVSLSIVYQFVIGVVYNYKTYELRKVK